MSIHVTLVVSEALADWLSGERVSSCDVCSTVCLNEELKEINFPAGEHVMQTFRYCSPECLETISRRMEAKP